MDPHPEVSVSQRGILHKLGHGSQVGPTPKRKKTDGEAQQQFTGLDCRRVQHWKEEPVGGGELGSLRPMQKYNGPLLTDIGESEEGGRKGGGVEIN
jgi:hypothetical protein